MSVFSQTRRLDKLRKRYFCQSIKELNHSFICRIYRADHAFCDCGLMHDLELLDFTLASIIFPNFEKHLAIQEGRDNVVAGPEEQAEAKKVLEEVFGPLNHPEMDEIKYEYDDMKRILKNVFKKKHFPMAFRRLDAWLDDQLQQAYSYT